MVIFHFCYFYFPNSGTCFMCIGIDCCATWTQNLIHWTTLGTTLSWIVAEWQQLIGAVAQQNLHDPQAFVTTPHGRTRHLARSDQASEPGRSGVPPQRVVALTSVYQNTAKWSIFSSVKNVRSVLEQKHPKNLAESQLHFLGLQTRQVSASL